MAPSVFTIAPSLPFADTLARGLIARVGADDDALSLSDVTIFLPTRRAVRTLSEAFTKAAGGAVILPDIRALGEIDEDEALLTGQDELALPPSIGSIRQRLLLATLVQRWDLRKRGGTLSFAQAAALARGLGDFLHEAETQRVGLDQLDSLVPAGLAEHWTETREFLSLLRGQWPALLAAEGAMNPAAHRDAALAGLAQRLQEALPKGPVIAAGSTGSIPATAELLRVIAGLPNGAVILPGLDRGLEDESWRNLDAGHPQFGISQLLGAIGIGRDAVADWGPTALNPARETLLRETLRPAPTTDAWRALAERGDDAIAAGLDGLTMLEAAHPGEEAAAIAVMLREVLNTPARTAALVTPDRNLARRVAAEMARWGIAIDDSAGRPLAHTAPGTFLCLLAEAAEEGFAPVALLALLKHPLAAGGEEPATFRNHVAMLDRLCLRGPPPDSGLDGVRSMIKGARNDVRDASDKIAITAVERWFDGIDRILAPLAEMVTAREMPLTELLARHIAIAEALAATDTDEGAARLWQGDAGNSAAAMVASLAEAAADLPAIEPGSYPVLFCALAAEQTVRPQYGRHPRLAILGPLEARLQSFDLIILGSLNEDSWPRSPAMDAWLSRPMRAALGLEPPERSIGRAAHDFATLAAAKDVVLTRALKANGSPTVASRWWQRLEQLTQGLELSDQLGRTEPYLAAARAVSDAASREGPVARPTPRPPVAKRPRSMSVTEIETWLRDPYAIYAKHVLKLAPLDPHEAEIGPLERGTAIHTILERFAKETADALPADADLRLMNMASQVFDEIALPRGIRALWYPRFVRAARWFVGEERKRRMGVVRSHVEIRGTCSFEGSAGKFTLRARADRIDALRSGGAAVIDYKTGNPPTQKQVETLLAPQLPLEGALLAQGGFADVGALAPAELVYIRFGGGAEPGEVRTIRGNVEALAREAADKLIARIRAFDDEATPYLPRVKPFRADQAGDYDHLARVREWSLIGWESEP